MADFYDIIADDIRFADRWFLEEPVAADGDVIDSRGFCYGRPYDGKPPVRIPVKIPGTEVAFTFGPFDMPVVTADVLRAIRHFAGKNCESYPVTIDGSPEEYFILNVVRKISCVDEENSGAIMKWLPEDNRPDKLGSYRQIIRLRVDPTRVGPHHIFRVQGWSVALIVSRELKEALERIDCLGITFAAVT